MSKIELDSIVSGYNLSKLNENFQKIEDELNDKVLYRDNPAGEDNQLETDVDANNKRIINLPDPISASEPVRKQDLEAEYGRLQGIADTTITEVTDLRDEVEGFYSDAATLTNYQGYWQTGVSTSDKGMSWSYAGLLWLCNVDGTTADPSKDSANWSLASSEVKVIESVFDTSGFSDLVEGQSVELISYHTDSNVGGGRGVGAIARHNGGTAISKTRTRPTDWTDQAQLTAWFADSGSDELCFVRPDSETVYATRFGVTSDGVDSTKALAAAKSAALNKVLQLPDGVIRSDTITLPEQIKGMITVQGAGNQSTGIIPLNADTPVFAKEAGVSVFRGCEVKDLYVKAHEAGSTGPAFLLTGARGNYFNNIGYQSNAGADFYSLYDLASHPYLCYGNTFNDTIIQEQTGPTKVWDFNVNGTGDPAQRANVQFINRPWIYGNTGMSAIVDAQMSAAVTINDPFFEANPGCDGVIMGNTTNVNDGWMELQENDFVYKSDVNGTSNACKVDGAYLSTPHTVNFPSGCVGNIWVNVTEASASTFTGSTDNNRKVFVPIGTVTPPTITRDIGDTGSLSFVSAVQNGTETVDGVVNFTLKYDWDNDNALTNTRFILSAVTGYDLISAQPNMLRNSSGEPTMTSMENNSTFWVYNKYDDASTLTIFVMYQRQ